MKDGIRAVARSPWFRRGLLVLWALFIWSRSLTVGPESSSQSLTVVQMLSGVFGAVGVTSVGTMQFVVRKLAHFAEYFVLGFLDELALGPGRPGTTRATEAALAVVAVGVPVADECLQLFVPGREGALRDVLIDLAGCLCGILVARFVFKAGSGRRSPSR